MYAIVKTGGKQYKVAEGDVIEVEKLDADLGGEVALPAILLVDGETVTHDAAKLAKVAVTAEVVAQTKGDVGMYHYDVWAEDSIDVFSDGGALWHATPTGRDRLDPALIKDHEAKRAAVARLHADFPSGAPAYLAALRLLGADGPLIAECAKLPR